LKSRISVKPLPSRPYEYAEWKKAKVNNYHIEIDRHYYSVPYQLAREQVEVRLTSSTVEVLFKNKRAAGHQRDFRKGAFTTLTEHMPKNHQRYLEWTPSRIIRWAQRKMAQKLKGSSLESWIAGHIRSRATDPHSVSCAWEKLTPPNDSKPPVSGLSL